MTVPPGPKKVARVGQEMINPLSSEVRLAHFLYRVNEIGFSEVKEVDD